ncbi:MAG: hypothetical protein JW801_03490 [Bacteroidales bacterium]|nr:hypothetical protein [Bacteroidales bacterium]
MVNEHFFEGGARIPERDYRRYTDWHDVIDTAIICDPARWNSESSPKPDIRETSPHSFIDTYFPVHTENVFKQLIFN